MKRFLKWGLMFMFLKGTFVFANNSLYETYLNLVNNDIKTLNDIFKEDLLKANDSVNIELLTDIVRNLDNQINLLNKNLSNSYSKIEVEKMLDLISTLSSQNYELAKLIVKLSNEQANNANESYKHTLDELIYATLRLSDDIGVMADRILLMAEQIGIMADRILETQRIQSENYNNTINLLASLK